MGQFQALRQGDSSTLEYLDRAQHLVEDLALAGQPLTLTEQNLYVFRGLRLEFRSMVASLAVNGTPVTIPQLADYLQAQQFIHADDFPAYAPTSSTALYAGRGGRHYGTGGRGQNRDGGGRGGQNRGNQRGKCGGRGRNSGLRCQICDKQGHSATFCYKRYSEPPPSAHVAVAGDAGSGGLASAVTSWLPDTGASTHATPDSGVVSQADEYHGDDVLRVGNGTGLKISSVGHADSITQAVPLKGPSSGGLYSLSVPNPYHAFVSARASSTVQLQLQLNLPWSEDGFVVPNLRSGLMLCDSDV
ncbi:PREDICTED: protein argonaute 2-like [Ipomoea nil]|uniref:protein argonaute 2-like n=1 Tax=Ipomoea nil TaxID=35883 RepID=UPI000901B09E|nr:PREDICTED: protein argonaute 2-like [Ipomoea nil]